MSKEQQKQFLIFYSTVQHSTVQCNATHHEALPGLAAGAGGRDGRQPGGGFGGDQTIYNRSTKIESEKFQKNTRSDMKIQKYSSIQVFKYSSIQVFKYSITI